MVGDESGRQAELGCVGLVPGATVESHFHPSPSQNPKECVYIPVVPATLLVLFPSWEDLPSSAY